MKDACDRFLSRVNLNKEELKYMYYGNEIDEDFTIEEIVKEKDKDKDKNIYKMKIIVLFNDKAKEKIKDIICPECKDNILIKFEYYKINCYGCIKQHEIKNLLFDEFEKTQIRDLSIIKCDICLIFNKANTNNHEFYKCLTCNNNLCPKCKNKHKNGHMIKSHDKIHYYCHKHNYPYLQYCNECKKNIC